VDGDRADGRRPLHRAAPDRARRGGGGGGEGGSALAPGSPAWRGWRSPSGLCPHGAAHLHATTTLEHTPSRRPLVFGTLDSFGATCFWRHGAGVRRWMDGGEVEPSRARRRPGRTPGGAARRVPRLRLWARSAAPLRRAGRGQMLRLLFHRSLACSYCCDSVIHLAITVCLCVEAALPHVLAS